MLTYPCIDQYDSGRFGPQADGPVDMAIELDAGAVQLAVDTKTIQFILDVLDQNLSAASTATASTHPALEEDKDASLYHAIRHAQSMSDTERCTVPSLASHPFDVVRDVFAILVRKHLYRSRSHCPPRFDIHPTLTQACAYTSNHTHTHTHTHTHARTN